MAIDETLVVQPAALLPAPGQLRPKVTILSGISGAGKTRLVGILTQLAYQELKVPPPHAYSADGYWHRDGGEYHFDPADIGKAHAWCYRRYLGGLEKGHHWLIVDNTNTSAWEIAPYLLAAEAYGYMVQVVRVPCPLKRALEQNQHGTPLEALAGQWARFKARDVLPHWDVVTLED